MHSRNLVHRDLKDENVVIDCDYNVKLIDFGSTSTIPDKKADYFTKFNGTAHFASPEIVKGLSYRGPEAEIWALGVVLHTIIYGENPFHSPDDITSFSKNYGSGSRRRISKCKSRKIINL